jgi:type I restriction enzyme, S subunit
VIATNLPTGWVYRKARECMDVRDGTHDSPKYVISEYPLVTSKNLINGKIDFSTCSFISKEDLDAISKRSAVDDGDILYAMIGTIGNPVIVKKQSEFAIKNVALFKFNNESVFN